MKAIEFMSRVEDDGLRIPKRLLSKFSGLKKTKVRVMVLIEEPDDEQVLPELEAAQFLKGYAESDSIYDKP